MKKSSLKNIARVLCVVLATSFLAACDGTEYSPSGILQLAGQALQQRDITKFRSLLAESALQHFKDPRTVYNAMNRLDGKKLGLGEPILTREVLVPTTDGTRRKTQITSTDIIDLEGNRTPFVNATVVCNYYLSRCSIGDGGSYPCWMSTGCMITDFQHY